MRLQQRRIDNKVDKRIARNEFLAMERSYKKVSKRVIILNYGLHISGVSRTLVNFANALVNHGYEVTIKIEINDFTLQSELDSRVKVSLFLEEPHPFGIRIKGFLRFYSAWLKHVFQLSPTKQYQMIVKDHYDIEIAFNRGAAARVIAASTNPKSKKLVWVHSDYMRNDNPLAGFDELEVAQEGYRKFDTIVCVSKQALNSFAEKLGEGYNLCVRYNIMDVGRIREFSDEFPVMHERFRFVAIGRLCEAKNYRLLIDAISLLNQKHYDFDCSIIGGGALEDELKAYAEKNDVGNIHFLGAKSNPFPYLKCADVYVSSSIYEGLSTTTIEAIILGKPCIVTNCAGMHDILGYHNEFGIIVPFDANALADAMDSMMTNEKLRVEYSKKAIERSKYFYQEKAFKDIELLFFSEEENND